MKMRTPIFPLKVLLILTAVLFGGFYEFVSCMETIALGGYLLYLLYRKKTLSLYLNRGMILVAVIVAGYAVSVISAVDKGMALIGVVKFLPLFLFALVLMQLSEEERGELLLTVPFSGVLIVGGSVLLCWIPAVSEYFFLEGRLGGTFQYSNTMALFFLAGVILVQGEKKAALPVGLKAEEKKRNHVLKGKMFISAVLILGIFLTGSRSVFVMTAVVLVIFAWRRREFRMFNAVILAAAVGIGAVYSFVSGDYQNLGRFLTISLTNSTLAGRLLYWQDALPLVAAHPLGLGYMGYYYVQGSVQTGVYTTVFVHNDFLQILLDIGWVPGIAAAAVFLKSLFSRTPDDAEKAVLAVIGMHCLFDFDMQFLSMGFLFLMTLGGYKDQETERQKVRKGSRKGQAGGKVSSGEKLLCAGMAVPMFLSLYFMVPLLSSYLGNNELARTVYPCYTEANLALLERAATREEGETLADGILRTNRSCALAFDAKALACAMDGDYEQMIAWKEKALEYHPYALYEYVDYVSLLSRGLEEAYQMGDGEQAADYRRRIREIPDRLEGLNSRTSALGWMIRDLPETELPDEMMEYIKSL